MDGAHTPSRPPPSNPRAHYRKAVARRQEAHMELARRPKQRGQTMRNNAITLTMTLTLLKRGSK